MAFAHNNNRGGQLIESNQKSWTSIVEDLEAVFTNIGIGVSVLQTNLGIPDCRIGPSLHCFSMFLHENTHSSPKFVQADNLGI